MTDRRHVHTGVAQLQRVYCRDCFFYGGSEESGLGCCHVNPDGKFHRPSYWCGMGVLDHTKESQAEKDADAVEAAPDGAIVPVKNMRKTQKVLDARKAKRKGKK